jgi:hypothetical protein
VEVGPKERAVMRGHVRLEIGSLICEASDHLLRRSAAVNFLLKASVSTKKSGVITVKKKLSSHTDSSTFNDCRNDLSKMRIGPRGIDPSYL